MDVMESKMERKMDVMENKLLVMESKMGIKMDVIESKLLAKIKIMR